jgi:hypothetical protein
MMRNRERRTASILEIYSSQKEAVAAEQKVQMIKDSHARRQKEVTLANARQQRFERQPRQ